VERNPVASELTDPFDFETLCDQDFTDAETYRASLELSLKAAKSTIPARLTELCRGMQLSLSEAHRAFKDGNTAAATRHASDAKTHQTDLLVELNALWVEAANNVKGLGHCVDICSALAKLVSKLVVIGPRTAPRDPLPMPRVASVPQLIAIGSPLRSSPIRAQSPAREREKKERPLSPDNTRTKAYSGSGPDCHSPGSPLRATPDDAPHEGAEARSSKKRVPGGEHSPTLKEQSPKRQKSSSLASSPPRSNMNRVSGALPTSPGSPGDGKSGDKIALSSASAAWRAARSSRKEQRLSMTSLRSPACGMSSTLVSPHGSGSGATAINTQASGQPPGTANTAGTDITAGSSPRTAALPALGSLSPGRSERRKSMQLSPQPLPRRMTSHNLMPEGIDTGASTPTTTAVNTTLAVATDTMKPLADDAPPPRTTADADAKTAMSAHALAMPDSSGPGEANGEHA
jgi:hypothetical protein